MIEANELRIGNWVNIKGHNSIFKILDIGIALCTVNGGPIFKAEYEEMFPIPLTPEILEKYGFHRQTEKTVTGFTKYAKALGMMLLVDDSENPFSNIEAYYERHFGLYECIGNRRNLKLHQLQNLYFALTGEELKPVAAIKGAL